MTYLDTVLNSPDQDSPQSSPARLESLVPQQLRNSSVPGQEETGSEIEEHESQHDQLPPARRSTSCFPTLVASNPTVLSNTEAHSIRRTYSTPTSNVDFEEFISQWTAMLIGRPFLYTDPVYCSIIKRNQYRIANHRTQFAEDFSKIWPDVSISAPFRLAVLNHLTVGRGSSFGPNCEIYNPHLVVIGSNVHFGENVKVTSIIHGSQKPDVSMAAAARVKIGDKVEIGDNVQITGGVHISSGTCIPANSLIWVGCISH